MSLTGKGFFIWNISRISGGNATAIANLAQSAGLKHVLIKIADGKYKSNYFGGVDLVPGLVNQLRARGIRVWGWQYVYGASPKAEADMAASRVKEFNLDGFVVDAESQFKAAGMATQAEKYMKQLRLHLPKLPIALSTYRYPSVHPAFPFTTFLKYCDIAMPQVYWQGSTNSAEQLKKSYNQYKALKPSLPYIPTGAAYAQGDWTAKPAQLTAFLNEARSLGLAGANFWEWYTANDSGGKLWKAVSDFNWSGGSSPPQPTPTSTDIAERFIHALNTGDPAKVTILYEKKTSKHIYINKTIQGRAAIYAFYYQLLRKKLPGGKFELFDLNKNGTTVELKWRASSKAGKVNKSKDTIRVSAENPRLISLHHSNFQVV